MSTAEFIVCELLDCGSLDIEAMFGTITENDLFHEAVQDLNANGIELSANMIWYRAMELALYESFGPYVDLDDFEIYDNALDSSVSFNGDKDSIQDYDLKAAKFNELTGYFL